jgi:hypothetical protein
MTQRLAWRFEDRFMMTSCDGSQYRSKQPILL